MNHDFLAAMALENDDETIDKVVMAKDSYQVLNKADWTCRAQVLATGMIHTENSYPPNKKGVPTKSLNDLLKNGREGGQNTSAIGGYPKIIDGQFGFGDQTDLSIAALCSPSDSCLDLLPDGSARVRAVLELTRPFHSKDDRSFYPHANPLKREWVFGKPYLAAGGVKGLLRWAWRMAHEENNDREAFIFGPRSEEMREETARQGCLYTWPLFWQGTVGLEVINAQNRDTLAGTDPIKYEVVKQGASTILHILLFNRAMEEPSVFIQHTVIPILQVLHLLLTDSGVSAKRSADWGSVKIKNEGLNIHIKGVAKPEPLTGQVKEDVRQEDHWLPVMDTAGNLLPFDNPVYSNKMVVLLTGKSEKRVKGKFRDEALALVQKKFAEYQMEKEVSMQSPPKPEKPAVYKKTAPSAEGLAKTLRDDFPLKEA